jgi:hypothetical protein
MNDPDIIEEDNEGETKEYLEKIIVSYEKE